jgi:hypothetical protein
MILFVCVPAMILLILFCRKNIVFLSYELVHIVSYVMVAYKCEKYCILAVLKTRGILVVTKLHIILAVWGL